MENKLKERTKTFQTHQIKKDSGRRQQESNRDLKSNSEKGTKVVNRKKNISTILDSRKSESFIEIKQNIQESQV
jgi:hypothetical protein